ncbi:histone deacetylase [Candidatus Neomarinimicrobiota bacterium]
MRNNTNIGLITSKRFLDHDTGNHHPESPNRLKTIDSLIRKSEIFSSVIEIEPRRQKIKFVELVHDLDYIARVQQACELGAPIIDTVDNPISADSFDVAVFATSAVAEGVDRICTGELTSVMSLVRPPGHHAEKNMAMGFCLFNNVAIAARYAQKQYGVEKIVIIDFDVHHGNGTQHLFENDPNILYISTHQYPFYPGTGHGDEKGTGDGLGKTINYPLKSGSGDEIYLDIFNNSIADIVLDFRPELLILSAGFDAHEKDIIGGMNVTTEGYYEITKSIMMIAKETSGNKILSVLEGGYHLDALAESVVKHIEALAGK